MAHLLISLSFQKGRLTKFTIKLETWLPACQIYLKASQVDTSWIFGCWIIYLTFTDWTRSLWKKEKRGFISKNVPNVFITSRKFSGTFRQKANPKWNIIRNNFHNSRPQYEPRVSHVEFKLWNQGDSGIYESLDFKRDSQILWTNSIHFNVE